MHDIKNQETTKLSEPKPIFTWCRTELGDSGFSRRCFMTGEYCSHQENVKRERKNLHENKKIKAFVDMSYSNISDVLYKWRLKSFIESLKNRLYFNRIPTKPRLYCIDRTNLSDAVLKALIEEELPENTGSISDKKSNLLNKLEELTKSLLYGKSENENPAVEYDRFFQTNLLADNDPIFDPVKELDVIRADSDPSSNFVICNRVCQQMQIADLIIADVSVENANVFYELGMAVALDKMILPICYSERYYEGEQKTGEKAFEHHIDCFPWRRKLFEHFGIRFRNNSYIDAVMKRRKDGGEELWKDDHQWETGYLPFAEASKPEHGFSDVKYDQFPYLDRVCIREQGASNPLQCDSTSDIQTDKAERHPIGRYLYEKLAISYNYSTYNENTLVLYTMDSILNEAQAARCVINYYQAVVRQFRDLNCFRGERVGVLLQSNKIPEEPKDGSKDEPLRYSVGDIIQIGVNQATYRAHMELIKPDEFFRIPKSGSIAAYKETDIQWEDWNKNAVRYVKEFVRNRGIPIYCENPLYVKRITDGLQEDIFEDISPDSTNYPDNESRKEIAKYFYCLYHVILRTLRFTNEVVVDISTNSVQSFFWLGAAHGSDTNAITVRRNESDRERQMLNTAREPRKRAIFDVAGLWTAVYSTENTESFYEQLAKAQSGIESRSRLVLKNRKDIDTTLMEDFWEPDPEASEDDIQKLHQQKEIWENAALESYYRNYFWRPMLRYNQLRIYLRKDENTIKNKLYRTVREWDVEAVGLLSHYLSKKTQIGEYQIKPMKPDESDPKADEQNFICIGQGAGSSEINRPQNILLKERFERKWKKKTSKLDPSSGNGEKEYIHTWARLIIQREGPAKGGRTHGDGKPVEKGMDLFRVFITGYSGPETKALASILVDEILDQSENWPIPKFPCEKEENENYSNTLSNSEIRRRRFPLLTLQEEIRSQFSQIFSGRIDKAIEEYVDSLGSEYLKEYNLEDDQVKEYFQKVSCITTLYVNTVLYRYFLPLLSKEDIVRIGNGMKMFISSLRAANRSPFDLQYSPHTHDNYASVMPGQIVGKAAELVLLVLNRTLSDIREVQAFYEVETSIPKDANRSGGEASGKVDSDSRKIVGIIQREKHGVKLCVSAEDTDGIVNQV